MTVAYGVDRDTNGNGIDALTLRHVIASKWNNSGIVTGLSVSGRSNLQYAVAAGMAVCTMSAADGAVEAWWPGGVTENSVSAGDATYARIDTIYMLANTGTPDNLVHVLAQQGTPAATPVAPSLPAGARALASFKMPAGGSTTAAASQTGSIDFAIRMGAPVGLLVRAVENYEGPANYTDDGKDYYSMAGSFSLPTDRTIEFRFTGIACSCLASDKTKPTTNPNDNACWYAGVQLDNADIPNGGVQFQVARAWQACQVSVVVNVAKGSHMFRLRNHRVQWGNNLYFICHSDSKETYPGRSLEVWDRGATK